MRRLFHFIGYGTLDAPVWFIGQEERLPPDVHLEDHLVRRSTFSPVMDCAEAHEGLAIRHLHQPGRGEQVRRQATWSEMCWLMLRLSACPETNEFALAYQADLLGRRNGQTLLTELLPLPRGNVRHWPYAELLPQFDSPRAYRASVLPQRLQLLRGLLDARRPQLVVCYGSPRRVFETLFDEHRFERAEQNSPLWRSVRNNQAVLLVPHFAQQFGAFPRRRFLDCAVDATSAAGLRLPVGLV